MDPITQTEDVLIAKILATMKGKVKTVEWAPPEWDVDFLKRNMINMPGVFVIFCGGPQSEATDHTVLIESLWEIVAVTCHAQGPKERARGDASQIGCYTILSMLAPVLDGFDIQPVVNNVKLPSIGSLKLTQWNNDMALKLDKQAVMIQSLSFTMPIELTRTLDPGALVPFKTFHDTFDIGQLPGAPITDDTVELQQ